MKKYLQLVLAVCLVAFISACGGGGGSAGSKVPVTSTDIFQVKTAYVNYLNDSRFLPFTINGSISGVSVSGTGTLTQSNVTNGIFEGIAAFQKTSTVTASIVANDTTIPLVATSTSYVDSNYVPMGSSDGDYRVVTNAVNIPDTALVNDAGIWFTENIFTSSDKTLLLGTSVTSFVLLPDTASTAILKMIQTEKDTVGIVTMTSTVNFRMTPEGGLMRLSETGVGEGMNLTFTY